jgi:hypothetical protein
MQHYERRLKMRNTTQHGWSKTCIICSSCAKQSVNVFMSQANGHATQAKSKQHIRFLLAVLSCRLVAAQGLAGATAEDSCQDPVAPA